MNAAKQALVLPMNTTDIQDKIFYRSVELLPRDADA